LFLELADVRDRVFSDCQCAFMPAICSLRLARSSSSDASRSFDISSVSFAERDLLDLVLADAPFDDVDLGRHRIDLDAQLGRGSSTRSMALSGRKRPVR
jgi:hypothetical protein